jgi:putative SOS response-associated peptidase YedK
MCVQFMIRKTARELSVLFGADLNEDFEFKSHVFPRYRAPVIGMHQGRRQIKPYSFGLIPPFEKNQKPKMVFHNARVETLHEKASFRGPFSKQRCLIPLEFFFEYLPSLEERPVLARIYPKDGAILAAAGLYSQWKSPAGEMTPTFTMITRPAPEFILDAGHDRCPYFLTPAAHDAWLSGVGSGPHDWYQVLEAGRLDPEFDMERANLKNG